MRRATTPTTRHVARWLRALWLGAFTLALGGSLIQPPASASETAWTHFRHHTLSATTETVTECTVTHTWVHAGTSSQGPLVHYAQVRVDHCTGEETAVSGTATPTRLRFPGAATSARLIGIVPLTDVRTGDRAGTVALDYRWMATSPRPWRTHRVTVRTPAGYRLALRGAGRMAEAEVTGTPQIVQGYIGDSSALRVLVSAGPTT